MAHDSSHPIAVELSTAEAKLIVAALRQFQPFWPHDLDDLSRAELLAEIRQGIEHVTGVLDPEHALTS